MAITTFAELETALVDRIARADFTSTIKDECIALAEAEMQRELGTLDMETKDAAFSITGEYVALPTGFQEVRTFYVTSVSPEINLTPLPSDRATSWYASTTAGQPKFYEVIGSNFRFAPVPSQTFTATLVYLKRFTALSSGNTTNWIITNHPDAYLYGACKHAAIRLRDTEAAQGYATLFADALDSMKRRDRKSRWSGPGLTIRPA